MYKEPDIIEEENLTADLKIIPKKASDKLNTAMYAWAAELAD